MKAIEYDDIQGRILPPLDFHFHRICFRRIVNPHRTRQSIVALLPHITTAKDILERFKPGQPHLNRGLFLINIAFTYFGLLTLNGKLGAAGENAFREGLASRCKIIGTQQIVDSVTSEQWQVVDGNSSADEGREAHVVALVCGFDPALVANKAVTVCRSLAGTEPAGFLDSVFTGHELGAYVERPGEELREHFGFRDSITDPLKFDRYGSPRKKASKNEWFDLEEGDIAELKLDRFFCGIAGPNQSDLWSDVSEWGSYLVFLRLRQDVYNFHRFCIATSEWLLRELATKLSARSIAEQLVGRRLDGEPLIRGSGRELNEFMFDGGGSIDPDGLVCPHSAHIRRANQRDDRNQKHNKGLSDAYGRMMLRRGMPYGPKSPSTFDHPIRDDVDRGMHFIGIMSSIENQFEYIMRYFINNQGDDADRGGAGGCVDGLIGANSAETRNRTIALAVKKPTGELERISVNPCMISPDSSAWCWPTGGGYYFLPSLKGLRQILSVS